MTVGGEIDVAFIIRAYSEVCAMELMVSTVKSVKFFRIKAVEYGVVVVALTRKVSATARIIRAKVRMLELKVSTVRSVKLFSTKAVEYGVEVVAINRKVSATVVEASHVSTAPSGSPGKVAAKRSAIVERTKLFWSLSSRSWSVPVMVPFTLSPPTVSRSESKPGGEVIHSTETVAL